MTVLRQAGVADVAALDRFLSKYPETSMFLRGNLASYGICNTEHRHGTTYWLEEADAIKGVVACSNGGYLMCQAPQAGSDFWEAACDMLKGRHIAGMTGVPEQVNAWAAALGLARSAFSVKETEPLYRLVLDDLNLFESGDLRLRLPCTGDLPLLERWFDGYARDTGMTPTDGPAGQRAAEVFVQHPAARLLEQNGACVAMTSLNARVADTVQVGGVYVPPAQRGQGLGGAVVALQLTELHAKGAKVAILFAANAAAARAYERIGFQRIGSYEVALLDPPVEIKEKHHVLQT